MYIKVGYYRGTITPGETDGIGFTVATGRSDVKGRRNG